MKTVITRNGQMKAKFASNQEYIQSVAELTLLDYNAKVYEVGCDFLKSIFPPNTSYGNYYLMHEKSKLYWKWFLSEWRLHEQKLIDMYKHTDLPLNRNRWETRMEKMPREPLIERSFNHNYIAMAKHLKVKSEAYA